MENAWLFIGKSLKGCFHYRAMTAALYRNVLEITHAYALSKWLIVFLYFGFLLGVWNTR